MESFEETRIQEFKQMFIKYLEDHMELQLKVIFCSQNYIDTQGDRSG